MKYLQNLVVRFREIESGISKNKDMWNGISIDVSRHMDELETMEKEIADLKEKLSQTLSKARILRDIKKDELIRVEKKVIGVHADDDSKLKDYNIILKKYFKK